MPAQSAMKVMKVMKVKEDKVKKVMKAVLKKPSAAVATLNEKVSEWKKGVQGSESEDEASDKCRDKGKGQKFAKVKDSLPPHILDLYENEAKKQSSPRDFRTMIINKLFTKLPNGQYQINAKAPMFEEHKVLLEKKYGIDEQQAYPCPLYQSAAADE